MTTEITYKQPLYLGVWLATALEKEWRKYEAVPVTPDLAPGYELAQAWGYVVAGYFLMEQGLKAVLITNGTKPPRTHALSVLYGELPRADRETLSEHYEDFRHTFPGMESFPPRTLEDFLVNLDGSRDRPGSYAGSLDWRYFLTEEGRSTSMPLISIDVMHEIVFSCVQLVEGQGTNERAHENQYSARLHRNRHDVYMDWLTTRMNSSGWGDEGNRLELLWGPDYRDRHDYMVFEGSGVRSFFAPLPKLDKLALPVIDKRRELESFDSEEAFGGIGWRRVGPVGKEKAAHRHIMY